MRKNISLLITIVFVSAFLFSCGGKDNKTDITGKFDLSYKFNKGDNFKYKLSTISTSEESVQADSSMKSSNSQSDSYVIGFEVVDVDADKIAEMNINISSIKVDVNANGQQISFDTSKNPNKEEQQKFWQYAMQYSTPFRARVNPKGEVVEVSRLDKMIDKMNSLQQQKRELTAAERSKLSQDLSDGIIRPLIQLIFRELPKKSIAKDSSWQKSYPGQLSVFKIENVANFKLDDIVKVKDENQAKINVNLSVKWEGEKKGEQQGIKYNFEDPKITGSGSILFNIDKGLLTKSETLTTVELVAHIEGKDATQKILKTVRRDLSTNKNIIELIAE
jgi:hypothetical protein